MNQIHITLKDFDVLTLERGDGWEKQIYKICVDTEFDVIHNLQLIESTTGEENIVFIDLRGIFAITQESVESLLGAVMTISYGLESPVLTINTEEDVFNHISRTIYSRLDSRFFWMHSVYGNQLHLVGDKTKLDSIIGHPFFSYANKFDWSSPAQIAEKVSMDVVEAEKVLLKLAKEGILLSQNEVEKDGKHSTEYATPHRALERFLAKDEHEKTGELTW